MGYKIPDGAQVRLYYKVPENPKRSITFKTNSTGIAGSEFGLTVKNSKLNSTGNSVTAVPTERVSIEFTLAR